MWILLIVASVGVKLINSPQMPISRIRVQSNYYNNKILVCSPISSLKSDRAIYSLRTIFRCPQVNRSDYLYVNNSSAEVSEIQETKETPLWVYGVEFIGGTLGEATAIITTAFWISKCWGGESSWEVIEMYILTSTLLSSSFTWLTGELLKQDGSFIKSIIGAGVGSGLGTIGVISMGRTALYPYSHSTGGEIVFTLFFPQLGAVIGYNLK